MGTTNLLVRGVFGLVTCGMLTSSAAEGSIIQNGSFEGGLAPWTMSSLDANAVYGYVTNFGLSPTSSAMFGSAQGSIKLEQSVALTQGQQYHLSFWIYNLGIGDDQLLGLISNGQTQFSVGLGMDNLVGTGLESWTLVEVDFTAQINASIFRFSGHDNVAAFYIDDVSLTAVPAPAGVAPLALLGVVAGRRRRRA